MVSELTGTDPGGEAGPEILGVSIDSRSVEPGDLFVPIVAERDGHQFVGAAIDRGAVAYLHSSPGSIDDRVPSIAVENTGARCSNSGPPLGTASLATWSA